MPGVTVRRRHPPHHQKRSFSSSSSKRSGAGAGAGAGVTVRRRDRIQPSKRSFSRSSSKSSGARAGAGAGAGVTGRRRDRIQQPSKRSFSLSSRSPDRSPTTPDHSSTPEIVHVFYSEKLIPVLRDLLVDVVRPDKYDAVFGGKDFEYKSPGVNMVRMLERGRKFAIRLEEGGGDWQDRMGFAKWVEEAYVQAVRIDENVGKLMPEEINHLLAEFQEERVLQAILKPYLGDRKFRLLQLSIRRKSGHAPTHTMESVRSLAVRKKDGPREADVKGDEVFVGMPGDSFALEKFPEVKVWMDEVVDKGLGTSYNWRLNPRRRMKRKGQIRTRWIFRVSRGAPGEKTEMLIKEVLHPAKDLVPSMNWGRIASKYLPVKTSAMDLISQELPRIIKGDYTLQPRGRSPFPMVIPMVILFRNVHAIVGILRERKAKSLELILIDPHAEISFDESQTVKLLEDVPTQRPMTVVPAHITNPKFLAVQYAREGSCSISSLTIMLAAARFFRDKPTESKEDSANTLATKILRSVSDLDVVVASQLFHRL